MRDKTLSMEQKMTYFLMMSKPEQLPDNPNIPDNSKLGMKVKFLIDSGKMSIKFDSNGVLRCTSN